MKIGGHNEFWMVIGPIIAVVLVASVTMGGPDRHHQARRAARQRRLELVANTLR